MVIDPSTLNFNKKVKPDSDRLYEGRNSINLHIRETPEQIIKLVQPRGIEIKTYGYNVHRNRLAEGSLVTVYCNNQNPNILCQREYEELLQFVNTKLHVIRDNPYELRGLRTVNTKIITKIDSEDKADKAFNLDYDENGNVVGQL